MNIVKPCGAKYFVVFKDDYRKLCVTKLLNLKSQVFEFFRRFFAQLKRQTGNQVTTIRSNNGGEYVGNDIEEWLLEIGIRHEWSAPNKPQQNGVAKETHRTLLEAARSQIYAMDVLRELWDEALLQTTYVLNRTLTNNSIKTPVYI